MSTNQPSDELSASTIAYYDDHADEFVAGTVGLDMERLYEPFLSLLASGARVLDAGCGSGRDSLYFLRHGYRVTAFDGSREIVERASKLSGLSVLHMTFQQLDFVQEFDGIWACASLLHVPLAEMDDVFARLERALAPSGVICVSFKYGEGETKRGPRRFTSYNEEGFLKFLAAQPQLELDRLWTTQDVRSKRAAERWLNAVMRKR